MRSQSANHMSNKGCQGTAGRSAGICGLTSRDTEVRTKLLSIHSGHHFEILERFRSLLPLSLFLCFVSVGLPVAILFKLLESAPEETNKANRRHKPSFDSLSSLFSQSIALLVRHLSSAEIPTMVDNARARKNAWILCRSRSEICRILLKTQQCLSLECANSNALLVYLGELIFNSV